MPRAARQYFRAISDRERVNVNWAAIDRDSTVFVSVSEWDLNQHDPRHSPRKVGDATLRVENISPHGPPDDPNRGVTFVVHSSWSEPLPVVVDIIVLDRTPDATYFQPAPPVSGGGYGGGQPVGGGSSGKPKSERASFDYSCDIGDASIKIEVKGTGFAPSSIVSIEPGFPSGVFMAFGVPHACGELYPNPQTFHATTDKTGAFSTTVTIPVACVSGCELEVQVSGGGRTASQISTTSQPCHCG